MDDGENANEIRKMRVLTLSILSSTLEFSIRGFAAYLQYNISTWEKQDWKWPALRAQETSKTPLALSSNYIVSTSAYNP